MSNPILPHVHRLAKTHDDVELRIQARATREIRLRSLKLDPEKFYSRYENEVKQPLDFFVDRLRPAWAEHFVATVIMYESIRDDHGDPVLDEHSKFEAILVMINEHAKKEETAIKEGQSKLDLSEECLPTYSLAAIWVAPEYRGQKLGSRMIVESLQWLRGDAAERGWKRVRCQLVVKATNVNAIRLYRRFGFRVVSGMEVGKELADEVSMAMIIDIQTVKS